VIYTCEKTIYVLYGGDIVLLKRVMACLLSICTRTSADSKDKAIEDMCGWATNNRDHRFLKIANNQMRIDHGLQASVTLCRMLPAEAVECTLAEMKEIINDDRRDRN